MLKPPEPCSSELFVYALRQATEAAARAAYHWIGRGDKNHGDFAAIHAMRERLDQLPIDGRVLIGEGSADEFPELYTGEKLGDPSSTMKFDIAADPIEGTSYLAKGMTNAMAVIAMTPRGALFDPGPAFYVEKFAGPPQVKGKIDPAMPVAEKLAVVAKETGKHVEDLTVYVQEKPRHRDLVEAIHKAGARVALYPAGDVAGAILAAIPGSDIDALMGTGGVPEGMISAVAIKALGGEFMARIDPQLATERQAVLASGFNLERWYNLDDLVKSDLVYFCATGITTGLMLEGVERTKDLEKTQTMMVAGPGGTRQILTTWHKREG